MKVSCPNRSSKEFKDLVKEVGENKATALWTLHEGIVPESYYNGSNSIDLLPEKSVRDSVSHLSIAKGISFRQQHSTIKSISNQLFKELVDKGVLKEADKAEIYNSIKADFESLYNSLKSKGKDKIAEHIKLYIDNWKQVVNLSENRIKKFANVKSKAKEQIEELEDNQGALEKKNFEDGSTTFMLDSKDTASTKLKMFLAGIETGGKTYLGLKEYEDFDKVYNHLSAILADKAPSYKTYIELLSDPELAITRPWITDLITKLHNASGQVKNEFITAMTKHFTSMSMVLYNKNDDNYSFVIQDATENAIAKNIIEDWQNNLLTTDLVNTIDGEYYINLEMAKSLRSKVDSFKNKEVTEVELFDFMLDSGLKVPDKIISLMMDDNYYFNKNNKSTKSSLFSSKYSPIVNYVNNLVNIASNNIPISSINNPFRSSSVKYLAKQSAKYDSANLTTSHRVGDNTVHSYTNNKYLTNKAREILTTGESTFNGKSVKTAPMLTKLIKLNLENNSNFNGTNNKFLDGISKDSKGNLQYADNGELIINEGHPLFDQFNVEYLSLDVIKELYSKKGSGKLSETTTIDHEAAKLALFANQYTTSKADSGKTHRVGIMFYPTMSDKTTMFTVKTLLEDFKTDKNGKLLSSSIRMMYDKVVLPELNRVQLVTEELARQDKLRKEGVPEMDIEKKYGTDIKNYSKGATKMLIIPGLNKIVQDNNIDLLKKNPNEILKYLETYLNELIDQQIADWTKLGIVNNEGKIIADSSYLKNIGNNVRKIATDYTLNYMLHNMNMYQSFIGDPALYYKSESNNILQESKDTFTNMGKRLAGDLAPGIEMAWSEEDGENFSVAFINDRVSKSLAAEFYKSLKLDQYSEYLDIKGTDAQEFITWKEHLRILRAKGEIDQKDYVRISRLLSKGETLKDHDIKKVLQPIKPVYVNNLIENGVYRRMYIKSSAFPLIPQLTANLEIDKLRVAMESDKGADHAVFYTATKVGAPAKGIEMFNEDGSIKDNLKLTNTKFLPRSDWRIQQEIPYKESKTQINTGTQERKLLFNNIRDISDFKDPRTGKKITGHELEAQYNKAYGKLFRLGYNSLIKELVSDGEVNINKLSDILIDEAVNRGYSINDQLSVEIVDGKFRVPLWALSSADKVESLLSSIVNNRIIKQKHTGKSYVLGSEDGFKPQIQTIEEASDKLSKYKNKIVWTSAFDFEQGLLPHEFSESTIRNSQVMVSSTVTDKYGKIINVMEYAKEVNGKMMLDETKIPKEILQLFGFRIPTQGHNSMMAMEIVGFLPPEMGDLIIASRDLTKQMGSDFDVDKLYTYRYNTYQKEDGSVVNINTLSDEEIKSLYLESKKQYSQESAIESVLMEFFDEHGGDPTLDMFMKEIEKQKIQNDILDIHFSVLKNPNKTVQKLIAEPLAFGDLKKQDNNGNEIGIAKKINDFNESFKNNKSFSPITALYQRDKFTNALAGKAGVGVFSLDSTLHSQLQGKDVELALLDENGNNNFVIKFGKNVSNGILGASKVLNGYKHDGKKYISDTIVAFQSAAVDNENEQILDKLNINPYTFPVIKALTLLGFDENLISAFISQPIIVEYAEQLASLNSNIIKSDKKDEEVKEELMEKYNAPPKEDRKSKEFRAFSDKGFDDLMLLIEKREGISDYNLSQASILDKFTYLSMYGKKISKLQSTINSDSAGLDKSIRGISNKFNDLNNINSMQIINADSLFSDKSGNNSIIGHVKKYGVRTANKLFSNLIPYDTRTVGYIFSRFKKSIIGIDNIQDFHYKQIFDELKSYLYTKAYSESIGGNTSQRRYDLLIDKYDKGLRGFTKKSLATKLNILKNNELKDSKKFKFIHSLKTDIQLNGNPSIIKFNASKAEEFDEDAMYGAFIDLLDSNTFLPSIGMTAKEFTNELVEYSLLTGGLQKANEFLKYIPVAHLENIGFIESLNNINFENENEVLPEEFITQFIQHNSYIIPEIKIDANNINKSILTPKDLSEKVNTAKDLFIKVVKDKTPSIYKRIGENYHKIPVLGYKQFVSEYNWGIDENFSIINSNNYNTKSIKELTITPVKKTEKIALTELDKTLKGKEQLESLLDNVSSSKEYADLAKLIKPLLGNNIVSVTTSKSLKSRGSTTTDPKTGEVFIKLSTNQTASEFDQTLLRESIRAITKMAIKDKSSKAYKRLNAVFQVMRKRLEAKHGDKLKDLLEADTAERMVKNLEEFTAIFLTNKKAQELLKEEIFNGDKTFWDKLIQTMGEVLVYLKQEVLGGKGRKADLNSIILDDVLSLAKENKKIVNKEIDTLEIIEKNTPGIIPNSEHIQNIPDSNDIMNIPLPSMEDIPQEGSNNAVDLNQFIQDDELPPLKCK